MHPKKTRMFLRLRQLCLVARDLEPVVDDLAAVFALQVCHRDPLVGHFGLRNAVLPIGTGFLEVVAPLTEGTAAGRRLERRAGDGGYMVILDTDELSRWRTRVAGAGVRIAADLAHGDYAGLQLHPRDVGGAHRLFHRRRLAASGQQQRQRGQGRGPPGETAHRRLGTARVWIHRGHL